jgi:hypothetical protein
MYKDLIISDQFINCTDESTRKINRLFAQKKRLSPQTGGRCRPAHPPRLSHRTLPTLRKTWVQVLQGPWSWPQVLPVCQLSQSKAPTGLCTPAFAHAYRALTGQLPETEDSPRKYLRHQSRTPSKTRGTLTGGWPCPHRCRSSRDFTRQYAARSLGHDQKRRDGSTGGGG